MDLSYKTTAVSLFKVKHSTDGIDYINFVTGELSKKYRLDSEEDIRRFNYG